MGWKKQYDHLRPIKQVICIDSMGCKLLHDGIRNVIKQTATQYLIQFKSGAANWYSRDRFIDYVPKPKPVKQLTPQPPTNNINQLF